jgi:hypothetical protein
MAEKTEWELVDAPAADSSEGQQRQQQARQTVWRSMQTLLGPWWRWKLAGTAILAAATLVFFITVTGVAIVLLAAAALVALGINKVRQVLSRGSSRP